MTFFTSWVRKYVGVGVICSKKASKCPMYSWLIENRNTLHHILSSWHTIYPKMVDSLSWQLNGENSVSTVTPRCNVFDSL
jgi:hypothetical protein